MYEVFVYEVIMSSVAYAPEITSEMRKNLDFFKSNLDVWLKDIAYRHKHVVIADQEVKGVYDEFSTTLDYAAGRFVAGEFIIQEVIGENERISFLNLAQ